MYTNTHVQNYEEKMFTGVEASVLDWRYEVKRQVCKFYSRFLCINGYGNEIVSLDLNGNIHPVCHLSSPVRNSFKYVWIEKNSSNKNQTLNLVSIYFNKYKEIKAVFLVLYILQNSVLDFVIFIHLVVSD